MDLLSNSSNLEAPSTSAFKKKKYAQNYKICSKWENMSEYKGWLAKSHKGEIFAKCCRYYKEINIFSGRNALVKHENPKFHKKNITTYNVNKCIVLKLA